MKKSIFIFAALFFGNAYSADIQSMKYAVKFGPKLPTKEFVKEFNGRVLFGNVYVFNPSMSSEKTFLSKAQSLAVEYIQKSQIGKRDSLPEPIYYNDQNITNTDPSVFNDPQAGKVWSFKDLEENGVSVERAYREFESKDQKEIIVAVVDTGVDYNHEDLKEVMWRNPGEIENNGIDDDNNGYVDDIFGINTLIRSKDGKATTNIMDTHSHGTHVSGTIGAKQNNQKGIAGIASKVKIMGIRTVPNNGDELDIDVAEAFIYAAKNGARIINCSFGKFKNEGQNLIPDTIKYIGENYNVLVVAAAGNDSKDLDKNPSYPASFKNDNLLVIASTSESGKLSYFSNFGKVDVDMSAPGSNIYSTTPNNRYGSMSGTSMATPTTVGVLAEILSHNHKLSAVELKNLAMASSTKSSNYKNKMQSEGRVDLHNALLKMKVE
jgi:subtilisin family serine protease